MVWTISFHEAARAEADEQPDDIRAKLARYTLLIAEHGLETLPQRLQSI